jgi:hypothetical protein
VWAGSRRARDRTAKVDGGACLNVHPRSLVVLDEIITFFSSTKLLVLSGVSLPRMDDVFAFGDFLLDERELLLRHRGGTCVSDATLSQTIWRIRSALTVDGDRRDLIQTVARVGYRFVAPVRRLPRDEPPSD